MSSSQGEGTSDSSSNSSKTSAFDQWRSWMSWQTGLGLSQEEREERSRELDILGERRQGRTCENWKKDLLHNSPGVVFMMQQLRSLNCNVTEEHLQCHPCYKKSSGAFSPEHGILLCQDGLFNKKHMEDTMVHEMIHMYDHVKFKVDWKNLRHVACSEIRAANLSGDCRFGREWNRGFLFRFGKHEACVRNRATISVKLHPECPDEATAERVVNEVWDSCIKDTRPFDEIYPS